MKKASLILLIITILLAILAFSGCEHEHEWGEWTTTKVATCTSEGSQNRTCECGETETKTIPAIGHTDGKWVLESEATCTAAGSKIQPCSVCNETIKTETIPAKGHVAGMWVVVSEATCTEAGIKNQTCTVCNETIKAETIPAKGHTGSEWITDTEATCTEAGSKHQVCSVCEETIKTTTIPAKGHTGGEWIIDTEATCTEDGSKHKTCSACNETTKSETITKLGHSWKNATCTEPKTCSKCEETTGSALGHEWENATCTTPQTCSVCKITGEPAHGHTWTNATCQSPKTCSVCKTTTGDIGDHTFVSGVCTICKKIDTNSDEYKYSLLKKKADGIVFSCARTVIRDLLKNPDSMKVLGEEILASDDYFRYYVKTQYSATNTLGGTVTDYAYVLVRVNPVMDGTFYYTYNRTLGIEHIISDSIKTQWGWGTEPDNWSLDGADKYNNPVEVSIKALLANPNAYAGQYVKIKEDLVLITNDLSNKKIRTYQSTGNGKYDYNNDNAIDVFYHFCDNVDDIIMLDADHQKITVIGEVKIYSNSTKPYIDAYQIIFDNASNGVIDVNSSYYMKVDQQNLKKTLYLDGGKSDRFATTTENINSAVKIRFEAAGDGYYMYFVLNGAKKYINIVANNSQVNIEFESTAKSVFKYDASKRIYVTHVDGANISDKRYFLGTYNSFNTLSACKYAYANSDFPAEFIRIQ